MRNFFSWIYFFKTMKYTVYLAFFLLLLPVEGSAQFLFQDVTIQSGVEMRSAGTANVGPGVIVLDFDNDGWDDLYLPGGFDSDKLYKNLHDGTFADVADSAFHLHNDKPRTRAGTAFDYNNDGLTDIYVCTENNDIFWRNNGNGSFTDVSEKIGMVRTLDQNQSNGATFGDFDGDGYNDLYVARWVNELKFLVNPDTTRAGFAYKGFPNWFYVNNGNGTFTERAKEFGIDGDTGCSNVAIFFDYDRDGDLDLLVGNDFGVEIMPNLVYKNMLMESGKATFIRVDSAIGMEQRLFCMGITPSDYDRDGDFDFFESSIGPMRLMQNNNNIFKDVAAAAHIPNGYMPGHKDSLATTWTPLFADFDNDGWEDLFITHGFLPGIKPYITFQHDTSVFLRNVGGTFEDVTRSTGVIFDQRGKGAALIDYDHDGKVDIVLGSLGAGIGVRDFRVFHNITPDGSEGNPKHWMQLKFTAKRTAKEAIGTTVDVWAGGIVHSRQISTGGGQASCNSLTAFVGLGKYAKADSINIFWPADKFRHRQIDHYENVPADQMLHYTENMDNTSVPSSHVNEAIKLYPTPAKNILNVQNAGSLRMTRYEIYNLLGIRQIDVTGSENIFSITVARLKPGCYMLRMTTNGNAVIKEFIKE